MPLQWVLPVAKDGSFRFQGPGVDDKDQNSFKNAGDDPWKGLGEGEEGLSVGVGVPVGIN